RVVLAAGGSTNAIIHLTAIAGRLGIEVDLDRVDEIGREIPVLVDLKPTGQHYMEDLHRAGGLTPLLRQLGPLLELDCLTITGKSLGENVRAARPDWPQTVVRPLENPIHTGGGLAILKGNIAPRGAVIKKAAANAALCRHRGRAVVFENLADLADRIDSADLDVGPDDILVLRNAGPKGGPGMPEAGYIPIPKKLAQQGVKDMVRISDARMSGTAFGTIVLHITPEAAEGGPLALVENGDVISLDVDARRLDLEVGSEELERRRSAARTAPEPVQRGYAFLHFHYVTQADTGCDLAFAIPPYTSKI
ncbi:MAG: dihydroxy-acid dehydratase, partial [Mesorhizobium sp.]